MSTRRNFLSMLAAAPVALPVMAKAATATLNSGEIILPNVEGVSYEALINKLTNKPFVTMVPDAFCGFDPAGDITFQFMRQSGYELINGRYELVGSPVLQGDTCLVGG